MESECWISFNQPEEEFRALNRAYRQAQATHKHAQQQRWEDPVNREAQYGRLLHDDLPDIQKTVTDFAQTVADESQRALQEALKKA